MYFACNARSLHSGGQTARLRALAFLDERDCQQAYNCRRPRRTTTTDGIGFASNNPTRHERRRALGRLISSGDRSRRSRRPCRTLAERRTPARRKRRRLGCAPRARWRRAHERARRRRSVQHRGYAHNRRLDERAYRRRRPRGRSRDRANRGLRTAFRRASRAGRVEAHSLCVRDDRGVHADEPAERVHERTAGVSRVERSGVQWVSVRPVTLSLLRRAQRMTVEATPKEA